MGQCGASNRHVALRGKVACSASHWRRQIDQGGVKVNGASVDDYEVDAATLDGALLQAGKRRFFRLRPA